MTATEKPAGADSAGLSVSPGHPPSGVSGNSITVGAVDVSSVLPPGVFMTADHRYYWNGEGPFPSVTTVLEALSKPALVQWKAREAVRAYIRNRAVIDPILMAEGEDAAIRKAMEMVDAQRDKAASIGTGVHHLADMVSRPDVTGSPTTPLFVSDEEKPYLEGWRAFLGFLEAHRGTIVSSEKAVWSLNGYAGTYDLLIQFGCDCHRGLWLIDIKTSKGYYPEYGLQLAGYRWADYIVLPDDPRPYPMPEIHRTGILHLRPEQYQEGWRLVEYGTTYEADYLTFLGALEIHRWRKANRFKSSDLPTYSASVSDTGAKKPPSETSSTPAV